MSAYWVEIVPDGDVHPSLIDYETASGPFNKHVAKGRFRIEIEKNPGATFLTLREDTNLVKIVQKG